MLIRERNEIGVVPPPAARFGRKITLEHGTCGGDTRWAENLARFELDAEGRCAATSVKDRWSQGRRNTRMITAMQAYKALVKGGRLVLDEPTDLPEGTEVELTAIDDNDFTPEERARLDAALELSMAQARAGQLIDADDVIDKLLTRR